MSKDQDKPIKRLSTAFYSEDLLAQTGGSIYFLVHLAILRSLELADGKPALVTSNITDKVTTIAFNEIAQGKVAFVNKRPRPGKI